MWRPQPAGTAWWSRTEGRHQTGCLPGKHSPGWTGLLGAWTPLGHTEWQPAACGTAWPPQTSALDWLSERSAVPCFCHLNVAQTLRSPCHHFPLRRVQPWTTPTCLIMWQKCHGSGISKLCMPYRQLVPCCRQCLSYQQAAHSIKQVVMMPNWRSVGLMTDLVEGFS